LCVFLLAMSAFFWSRDVDLRPAMSTFWGKDNRTVATLLLVVWVYHSAVAFYHDDSWGFLRGLLFLPLMVLYLGIAVFKRVIFQSLVLLSVLCAIVSLGIHFGILNFWPLIYMRNSSIFFDPNYAGAIFGFALILSLIVAEVRLRLLCV